MLHAVATALGSAALSSGPQPQLPGFLNSLASPLEHFGLWAILLLVLVEDFGIPVPGETVLIAGAIFAGSGRLNIVAVGVVGFCAAVVGDNIGYAIGRFGGRRLVDRWGKYVFLTAERLEKAEAFFARHGAKIIAIARFIEGLRQANGIIAGLTQMHWLRFLIFNAIGAALWVGTWVSVGYFAGQHITPIYNAITTYSLYVAIAAVVLIAAWIGHRIYKHRKSKAATAQANEAAHSEALAAPHAEAGQAEAGRAEAVNAEAVNAEAGRATPEAASGRQAEATRAHPEATDNQRAEAVEAYPEAPGRPPAAAAGNGQPGQTGEADAATEDAETADKANPGRPRP